MHASRADLLDRIGLHSWLSVLVVTQSEGKCTFFDAGSAPIISCQSVADLLFFQRLLTTKDTQTRDNRKRLLLVLATINSRSILCAFLLPSLPAIITALVSAQLCMHKRSNTKQTYSQARSLSSIPATLDFRSTSVTCCCFFCPATPISIAASGLEGVLLSAG